MAIVAFMFIMPTISPRTPSFCMWCTQFSLKAACLELPKVTTIVLSTAKRCTSSATLVHWPYGSQSCRSVVGQGARSAEGGGKNDGGGDVPTGCKPESDSCETMRTGRGRVPLCV